jgi:hypothetical protein
MALGAAIGADTTTSPVVYPDLPLAAVGGVGCELQYGRQGSDEFAELHYEIAPSAIATAAELRESRAAAPGCQTETCNTVAVIGDWWVQISFFVNTTDAKKNAAVLPVTSLIESVLHGRIAPTPPATGATSCGQMASAIASDPSIAGAAPAVTTEPAQDRKAGWPLVAAARRIGQVSCTYWGHNVGGINVTVVPHAVGIVEECATVAGATTWPDTDGLRVVTWPYDEGSALLCATDGVGSVMTNGIFTSSEPTAPPWDAAAIARAARVLKVVLVAARDEG